MAAELPNALHPSVVEKVDPAYAEVYNKYQAIKLRADQVPYEVYKQDPAKYGISPSDVSRTPPAVASDKLHKVPVTTPPGEIDVQVYVPTPEAVAAADSKSDNGLPCLVNYHGGGFVIGDLTSDINLCKQMCHRLGCIVVNVDYRTSPEFPHPTPAIDSWDALVWTVKHASELGIDASRVAVSGLSAGACIAAVCAIMARDTPDFPALKLQLLIVPVTDVRFVPVEGSADPAVCPYESYTTLEHAPNLPLHRLVWFYNLWPGTEPALRRERAEDWRASPLLAESHKDIAPASIHCGGVDPLVDEGRAFHEKLLKDGTPSEFKVYEGQGHPFGQWDGLVPAAREFQDNLANALGRAFAK